MANIVSISPKSSTVKYNGFTITTTWNAETGKWIAHATKPVTASIDIERKGKTINFAVSLAKRAIDRMNDQTTRVG